MGSVDQKLANDSPDRPFSDRKAAVEEIYKFGAFALDTRTGELKKHGTRVRLPDQPFRVLVTLLERPGQLTTREQLRERIWPGDSAGDFEQGLNRAVSKLRGVLNDRAVNPRFIETLPGRGYRFIAALEKPFEQAVAPKSRARRFAVIALVLLVLGGVLIAAKLLVPPPVPSIRWRKLTTDIYIKNPPALSDGKQIYFSASFDGQQFIAAVPLAGGHPVRLQITPPGPVFFLQDLSPDGQELLLTAAASNDRVRSLPLWTLNVGDGSARRLGSILATSAAYGPSGQIIAYSTPTELWTARIDGSRPRRLLEAKEITGEISWSLDGSRIRFARHDPLSKFSTPWEVRVDGSAARKLITSTDTSLTPAGWTQDGHLGIFFGEGAFWGQSEPWLGRRGSLVRLADDSLEFDGSVRVGKGNSFYAVGNDRLSELQSYDYAKKNWEPSLEGISAEHVEYSQDGQRVAYVTYPQRTLWVRDTDGKRPIQLTSPPLEAAFPRWSPDGSRIAFSANESVDKPMRLYIVDANGGAIRPAVPSSSGSQGYPTWSPDGQTLVYGIVNTSFEEEVYLRVANLATGKVEKLAGSEGLFAPRWSPDGRSIAALRFMGNRSLMLMRVTDGRWREVDARRVDWPTWMPDSRSILCESGDFILRYRVDTGIFEVVTAMKPEEMGGYSRWLGIGPKGSPIRALNRDSHQIYAIQLDNDR